MAELDSIIDWQSNIYIFKTVSIPQNKIKNLAKIAVLLDFDSFFLQYDSDQGLRNGQNFNKYSIKVSKISSVDRKFRLGMLPFQKFKMYYH